MNAELKGLIEKWRNMQGCDWMGEPDAWEVSFNVCADALEHVLAAPQAAAPPKFNAQDRLIVADELNQCLQIIVTNAGNILVGLRANSESAIAARKIEKTVARMAKAIVAFTCEAAAPSEGGGAGLREQIRKEAFEEAVQAINGIEGGE